MEGGTPVNQGTSEARLGMLERENCRLRLGMLAVVAAVGALVCLAATNPAPNIVRAQRFELVNAKGKVRAELALLPGPYSGAGLTLWDDTGEVRVLLRAHASGAAHLTLCGEKGQVRAVLSAPTGGAGGLTLRDATGRSIGGGP